MTFGDFERRFKAAASEGGEAEKTLGVLANALFDFTPATRPVYWRLLAIQATLYDGMSEIGYNRDLGIDDNDVAELLTFTPSFENNSMSTAPNKSSLWLRSFIATLANTLLRRSSTSVGQSTPDPRSPVCCELDPTP